jgi:hypothetical protein
MQVLLENLIIHVTTGVGELFLCRCKPSIIPIETWHSIYDSKSQDGIKVDK